jgi:hypothetical protein
MDTQIQQAIVATQPCVVHEVAEPARVQAWPGNADQPADLLGVTTRQAMVSVHVAAAPCSSRMLTWLTGAA